MTTPIYGLYAGADSKCVVSSNVAQNASIAGFVAGQTIIGADSMNWIGDNTLSFVQLVDNYLPLLQEPIIDPLMCPSPCGRLLGDYYESSDEEEVPDAADEPRGRTLQRNGRGSRRLGSKDKGLKGASPPKEGSKEKSGSKDKAAKPNKLKGQKGEKGPKKASEKSASKEKSASSEKSGSEGKT